MLMFFAIKLQSPSSTLCASRVFVARNVGVPVLPEPQVDGRLVLGLHLDTLLHESVLDAPKDVRVRQPVHQSLVAFGVDQPHGRHALQPVYRRVVRLPLHALLVRRDHPGLDTVHVPVVILRHQLRRPLVLLAQEADQVRCVARRVGGVLEVPVQDGLRLLFVAQPHVNLLNLAPRVVLSVVRGRDPREVGHPEPQLSQPRLHPLPSFLNVPQRFVAGRRRHINEVLDKRAPVAGTPAIEPVEEPVLRQRHGVGPVFRLRQLPPYALVLLLEVLRPGNDLRQVDLPLLQRVPQIGVDRVLLFRSLQVPDLVLLGAAVVDLLHSFVQGAQIVQGHLVERRFPDVHGVLLVQGLRKLRVVL